MSYDDYDYEEETAAPWWAFPPLAAVGLYAVNIATTLLDVDALWVAGIGAAAATGITVAARFEVLEPAVRPHVTTYAAATSVYAAAWSTWATATSPFSQPSIISLLIGLGVAWPLYNVVRREHREALEEIALQHIEVQEEEERIAHEQALAQMEERYPHLVLEAAAAVNLKGLHIEREIINPAGYTLVLHLDNGTTPATVKARLPRLEQEVSRLYLNRDGEALPTGSVTLEQKKGSPAFEILLHVRERDVLGQNHPLEYDSSPLSCLHPYDIGLYEDGEPIMVNDAGGHEWIVGSIGSGKDGLLRVKFHRWTRMVDQVLWVLAEDKFWPMVAPWLLPWATGRTDKPIFDWVANSRDEIDRMLLAAYKVVDYRQGIYRTGDKLEISRQLPAIRMVANEIHKILTPTYKLVTHRGDTMTRSEIWYEIDRLGRSEGMWETKAGQRPVGYELGSKGTSIKAVTRNRYMLGPTTTSEATYALDSLKGVDLSKLEWPGNLYANLDKVVRPMAGRVRNFPYEDVPEVAIAHTPLRPDLDHGTAQFLGQDYEERWTDPARVAYIADYYRSADGGGREVVMAGTTRQKTAERPATPPPAARPTPAATASESALGPVPDFAKAARESLRRRGIPVPDEKPSGEVGTVSKPNDTTDPDDPFSAIVGNWEVTTSEREVPEPLKTIIEKFPTQQFVSSADLAAAVGVTPTELGLTLARPPFNIRRDKTAARRPEYGMQPTRGFDMNQLRAVAKEFLRGERTAD
ncbi:hypothetical protein [Saccharothrix hoggarensis]|uniref:Uncharacterized protein n=1 Tax=Saccharothrix hoggarensis TaxID=913853 RepID=A0ABW3QGJ6_9PSEU